jgi:hypothetical protein
MPSQRVTWLRDPKPKFYLIQLFIERIELSCVHNRLVLEILLLQFSELALDLLLGLNFLGLVDHVVRLVGDFLDLLPKHLSEVAQLGLTSLQLLKLGGVLGVAGLDGL